MEQRSNERQGKQSCLLTPYPDGEAYKYTTRAKKEMLARALPSTRYGLYRSLGIQKIPIDVTTVAANWNIKFLFYFFLSWARARGKRSRTKERSQQKLNTMGVRASSIMRLHARLLTTASFGHTVGAPKKSWSAGTPVLLLLEQVRNSTPLPLRCLWMGCSGRHWLHTSRPPLTRRRRLREQVCILYLRTRRSELRTWTVEQPRAVWSCPGGPWWSRDDLILFFCAFLRVWSFSFALFQSHPFRSLHHEPWQCQNNFSATSVVAYKKKKDPQEK